MYLAESRHEAGGYAAVKIIDKQELCKDEDKMFLVDKEIEIMSQLDHHHIVRLYEVYESKTEVCLVMELAKGGELFDKLLERDVCQRKSLRQSCYRFWRQFMIFTPEELFTEI